MSLGCLGDGAQKVNVMISFGSAALVPGNTPGVGQAFDEITPDRSWLSATEQRATVRDWLVQLGLDQGFQGVEAEVAARLGP